MKGFQMPFQKERAITAISKERIAYEVAKAKIPKWRDSKWGD